MWIWKIKMTEEEIKLQINRAWAAGLFEGEGSILVYTEPRPYMALAVVSTDKDVIDRFFNIVLYSKIYFRRPLVKNRKDQYVWKSTRIADIREILSWMMPYLCNRRNEKAKYGLSLTTHIVPKLNMTSCRRGHIRCNDNIYINPTTGSVACRVCLKLKDRKHYDRKSGVFTVCQI